MSAQTVDHLEANAEETEPWNAMLKWVALASRFPLMVPADVELPCAGMQPEMFYEQRHWLKARRVCDDCPIREHCLEVAIARDEDGVWGGMTKAQRDRWVSANVRSRSSMPVPDHRGEPIAIH